MASHIKYRETCSLLCKAHVLSCYQLRFFFAEQCKIIINSDDTTEYLGELKVVNSSRAVMIISSFVYLHRKYFSNTE